MSLTLLAALDYTGGCFDTNHLELDRSDNDDDDDAGSNNTSMTKDKDHSSVGSFSDEDNDDDDDDGNTNSSYGNALKKVMTAPTCTASLIAVATVFRCVGPRLLAQTTIMTRRKFPTTVGSLVATHCPTSCFTLTAKFDINTREVLNGSDDDDDDDDSSESSSSSDDDKAGSNMNRAAAMLQRMPGLQHLHILSGGKQPPPAFVSALSHCRYLETLELHECCIDATCGFGQLIAAVPWIRELILGAVSEDAVDELCTALSSLSGLERFTANLEVRDGNLEDLLNNNVNDDGDGGNNEDSDQSLDDDGEPVQRPYTYKPRRYLTHTRGAARIAAALNKPNISRSLRHLDIGDSGVELFGLVLPELRSLTCSMDNVDLPQLLTASNAQQLHSLHLLINDNDDSVAYAFNVVGDVCGASLQSLDLTGEYATGATMKVITESLLQLRELEISSLMSDELEAQQIIPKFTTLEHLRKLVLFFRLKNTKDNFDAFRNLQRPLEHLRIGVTAHPTNTALFLKSLQNLPMLKRLELTIEDDGSTSSSSKNKQFYDNSDTSADFKNSDEDDGDEDSEKSSNNNNSNSSSRLATPIEHVKLIAQLARLEYLDISLPDPALTKANNSVSQFVAELAALKNLTFIDIMAPWYSRGKWPTREKCWRIIHGARQQQEQQQNGAQRRGRGGDDEGEPQFKWQYLDNLKKPKQDSSWADYDSDTSVFLEEKWHKFTAAKRKTKAVSDIALPNGSQYVVGFKEMLQFNSKDTSKQRAVRRVEVGRDTIDNTIAKGKGKGKK